MCIAGDERERHTQDVLGISAETVSQETLGESYSGPAHELPDGAYSLFRQLDQIIAPVANETLRVLYALDYVAAYAAVKDAIFSRYRRPHVVLAGPRPPLLSSPAPFGPGPPPPLSTSRPIPTHHYSPPPSTGPGP